MSVILETTRGDVVVDLYIKERPKTCINFLKLCKMKFYNFSRFHYVERNFLAQTGDPTGTGRGGESVYGKLYGEQARFYEAEQVPILKHTKPGILSMVNVGENMIGSQFFITLGDNLDYLDKEHCVFGEVVEGHDTLLKINDAICDENHVPYQDIRITHTVVLDDPFDDPAGLEIPPLSPEPTKDMTESGRIAADEDIDDMAGKTAEEVEEMLADREAKARATILEMVGDLPSIDAAPPENVLFVCKLNPVTTDEDLMIIFSRFGKINNCEIIRDRQTGNSLQYAFIEFDNPKSCEDAYFKMDNVLIDDRRIHVDFSQSVSKIKWKGKGRGVDFVGGKSFDPNKEDYKQNKDTRIDRNQHHGAEKSKHHFQGRDAKHESKQRDQRENWSAKNERHSKDGNSYNRDYSSHRSNRPYSDRSKDRSSPSRYSSDRNPRRDYQADRRNSGPSSEYSRSRHDPSTGRSYNKDRHSRDLPRHGRRSRSRELSDTRSRNTNRDFERDGIGKKHSEVPSSCHEEHVETYSEEPSTKMKSRRKHSSSSESSETSDSSSSSRERSRKKKKHSKISKKSKKTKKSR